MHSFEAACIWNKKPSFFRPAEGERPGRTSAARPDSFTGKHFKRFTLRRPLMISEEKRKIRAGEQKYRRKSFVYDKIKHVPPVSQLRCS